MPKKIDVPQKVLQLVNELDDGDGAMAAVAPGGWMQVHYGDSYFELDEAACNKVLATHEAATQLSEVMEVETNDFPMLKLHGVTLSISLQNVLDELFDVREA